MLFLVMSVVSQFVNKYQTNFSLSPGFDKLKLVGHQISSAWSAWGIDWPTSRGQKPSEEL